MKYLFSIFLLILFKLTIAQEEFPKNYFISPVKFPIYLAGNFGELRNNHFHAGLDIKTQGVIGKEVYAAAEGYVSRINVSPYGYGKALYITHPNGYTTVYGHLNQYSEKIEAVVKARQYQKESFNIAIYLMPNEIKVQKGELVAYSGNTGGSGGPHLHFEIRKSSNSHPYNPLFFGFDIKDQRAAEIYSIKIYPLDEHSLIFGKNEAKRFVASGQNGKYRLNTTQPISLIGNFGFGIESIDRMDETHNTYGLHNVKLWLDSSLIFEQEIKEFAFDEGRYLNALIDYEFYMKTKKRIQRSYRLAGNNLRFFKTLVNNGEVKIKDGDEVKMTYHLSDYHGNVAQLNFDLFGAAMENNTPVSPIKEGETKRHFSYREKNTFMRDNLLLVIPPYVLYEDLLFTYKKEEDHPKLVSPLYWIHNHYTPLHSYIDVSIKHGNLTEKQKKQALIVSTTNGIGFTAEGGNWNGDNISVKTRSFGGYGIALDSIPPKITPLNIFPNANMSKKGSIRIKVSDNLSGIKSYRAEVDGEWILMEYEPKQQLLFHNFDGRIKEGLHQFKIVVSDGVGNKSTYESSFII